MSSSVDAKLWLTSDRRWQNSQIFCKCEGSIADQRNLREFHSSEIHLKQRSFHLRWKVPHSKNFEVLSHKYFHSYIKESLGFKEFMKDVPLTPATQSYITTLPKHSILSRTEKFYLGIRYLEWNNVSPALPVCTYRPGYVGKRVVNQCDVLEHFVNPSYVYPEIKHVSLRDGKWNPWLDTFAVVERYLKKLGDAYPG